MGKFVDLTGQRFENLVAIKIAEIAKVKYGTVIKWLCRCDCGNTRICSASELKRGNAKHCGCLKVKNLVGKRFNKLVVIKRVENNKKRFGKMVVQMRLWKFNDCRNISIKI